MLACIPPGIPRAAHAAPVLLPAACGANPAVHPPLPPSPGILAACKDKSASSSGLKIEALSFLRAALEANAPDAFAKHVAALSGGVFAAGGERYYKVRGLIGGVGVLCCDGCHVRWCQCSVTAIAAASCACEVSIVLQRM